MVTIPSLSSSIPAVDRAFRVAVGDFLGNIAPFQGGLHEKPLPVIIAGMDYTTPWTRDAAFNTWFAGSLLAPAVARNTLLAVVEKRPRLHIGGEYWDAIIWVFGAWNLHLCTGDRAFLDIALQATENSLRHFEETEQDPADGLFRGGACFQDGVAGYPDRFVSREQGSGIVHCLRDNPPFKAPRGVGLPMKALSTNCLYLLAYQVAAQMRAELGLPADPTLPARAAALKASINHRFYDEAAGTYRYLLDAADPLPARQEGLGHAFAILSGTADGDRLRQVIDRQHVTPHGIACVWPAYDRYTRTPGAYGRHSGLIWPQVNATWAHALAVCGEGARAWQELRLLAGKAARDLQFFEIYHPDTGLPYGGLQEDMASHGIREWASCRRQTWCATGYINMVLTTLCGLRLAPDGITFVPWLPPETNCVELLGLPYRRALLNIRVVRDGSPRGLVINGKPALQLAADAAGTMDVVARVA